MDDDAAGDALVEQISASVGEEKSMLWLTDKKGRRVGIPTAKLSYVEIGALMGLTDNAVRAHLAALERDRLVVQSGLRRGAGKPSYTYALTPEAESFFPKAYGALLRRSHHAVRRAVARPELDHRPAHVGLGGGGADEEARADLVADTGPQPRVLPVDHPGVQEVRVARRHPHS